MSYDGESGVCVCEYTHCNASVVHFLDNRSAVGVMARGDVASALTAAHFRGGGASAAGSGAPAGDNRGQQSRVTIPFSSMLQFSLLQIDV